MQRGFFRSLFDISFTSFITTKIIKLVYVVTLVVVALVAVIAVIGAFRAKTALGIATLLVFAPLGALIWLIYARLVLELMIQGFRITELLRDQNHLQRTAFSAAGWLASDVAVTQPAVTTPATCPNCGAVPSPGAAFCRNCGHRFE
jgi:ribosomal protein L40E